MKDKTKKKKKKDILIERITKEQNPDGKSNTWHYVSVVDKNGLVGLHEIHFDEKGDLLGITQESVRVFGDQSKWDLTAALTTAVSDVTRYPTISHKEFVSL